MSGRNMQDLTNIIGNCGKFQIVMTLSVHAGTIMAAWGMMFLVFGVYNPGWACVDESGSNFTVTSVSFSLDGRTSTARNSHNSYYSDNKFLVDHSNPNPNTNVNNSSIWRQLQVSNSSSSSGHGELNWVTDCAVRSSCRNLIYNHDSDSVVTQWELYCDKAWIPSLIISIEMCGTLFGSYISGQVGDKFGRKVSLYGSVGLLTVFNIIAVFSVSWQMYTVLIFLIGLAVGGIISCSFVYPMEFVSEKWRGLLAGIPIWNAGCTSFALVALLIRNWKHLHIALSAICACVFMTVVWTPESVRWLAVHGKVSKAKQVVARISKMNSSPCPDTQIIDDIADEERIQMRGHKYTYVDLFKMKEIRGYSLKFGFIWTVMALTYYSINFSIKSLSGNFYINFLMFSFFELPGMLFVSVAVNRLGRRNSCLVYISLVVICSISLVLVSITTDGYKKDRWILILALSCKTLIVSAWAVVAVLSNELYPTVVRSLHYGYLSAVARFGAIVSPFLIPTDPNNIANLFIIISSLNFTVLCVMCTLPETKGRVLLDRARPNNLVLCDT